MKVWLMWFVEVRGIENGKKKKSREWICRDEWRLISTVIYVHFILRQAFPRDGHVAAGSLKLIFS